MQSGNNESKKLDTNQYPASFYETEIQKIVSAYINSLPEELKNSYEKTTADLLLDNCLKNIKSDATSISLHDKLFLECLAIKSVVHSLKNKRSMHFDENNALQKMTENLLEMLLSHRPSTDYYSSIIVRYEVGMSCVDKAKTLTASHADNSVIKNMLYSMEFVALDPKYKQRFALVDPMMHCIYTAQNNEKSFSDLLKKVGKEVYEILNQYENIKSSTKDKEAVVVELPRYILFEQKHTESTDDLCGKIEALIDDVKVSQLKPFFTSLKKEIQKFKDHEMDEKNVTALSEAMESKITSKINEIENIKESATKILFTPVMFSSNSSLSDEGSKQLSKLCDAIKSICNIHHFKYKQ